MLGAQLAVIVCTVAAVTIAIVVQTDRLSEQAVALRVAEERLTALEARTSAITTNHIEILQELERLRLQLDAIKGAGE